MRKRISESIQAKTFISMLTLLVGCCIIIYAMVMIFLPKNYQTKLEKQITSDFCRMIEILEKNGWEENADNILEFSIKNNASVRISDEHDNNVFSVNFLKTEDGELSPSISCSADFEQGGQIFRVSVIVSLVAVTQSYDILIKLIPLIAAMILLICSGDFSIGVFDWETDGGNIRRVVRKDSRECHSYNPTFCPCGDSWQYSTDCFSASIMYPCYAV